MSFAPPAQRSLDIVLIILDRATSTVTLVRSDKKEATFPLENSPLHPASRIARLTHVRRADLLYLETLHGEDIFAELPTVDDLAPLRHRPVVYLDQKDWSTVANAIYQPTKVPKPERDAALRLIQWAQERKVILPMSAGHMSETCKWTNGEARYRLALTILQLSSGWQMRDPLEVRRNELWQSFHRTFNGAAPATGDVFTLEPYALHGVTRNYRPPAAPADFPPDFALATRALTSLSGTFDTMLDVNSVAMGTSPGWVAKNQGFGDWLASESQRSAAQRRASIDVLFLADTGKEIAEEAFRAGISPAQMSEWIQEERDREIRSMPSLGLFRETLQGMHLNRVSWEDNHLTDLMYLTCAAGYADYVVGERSVTGYIRQAQQRLARPVSAFSRLRDLVPVLSERYAAA